MSESSRPPRDPRATLHDGEETLEQRVSRYRDEQTDTAADVVALTDRVDDLEQLVGALPSALPGARGSGLAQHLVDLTAAVATLTASIDTERKARVDALAQATAAREPWSRVAWLALGAAIAVLMAAAAGGALHWIATLHH